MRKHHRHSKDTDIFKALVIATDCASFVITDKKSINIILDAGFKALDNEGIGIRFGINRGGNINA